MKIKEFFESLLAKRETSKSLTKKALGDSNDAQTALASLLKSSKKYQLSLDDWYHIIERHPTQVSAIFAGFGPQKRFFGLITDRRHLGYQLTKNQKWETLLDRFNGSANTLDQFALRALADKMLQFAPENLEKWEAKVEEQAGLGAELQSELKPKLQAEFKAELSAVLKRRHNENKAYDTTKTVINSPNKHKIVQQRLLSLDSARQPEVINQQSVEIQKVGRLWLSLTTEIATRVNRLLDSWLRKEKYQASVRKLANEKQSLDYSEPAIRLNALDMVGVQQPSDLKAKLPLAHLDLASKPTAKIDIITAPKLSSAVKVKLNKLIQTPVKNTAQNALAIANTPLSSHSTEKTMSLKRVAASESLADDVTVYSGLSDFEGIDSPGFSSTALQKDGIELNLDPIFDREEIEYRQGKYGDDFNNQVDCEFETPKKRFSPVRSTGSSPLQELTRVCESPLTDDSSIDLQRVSASPLSSPAQLTPELKISYAGSATPFYTVRPLERVCPETDTPDSEIFELARVTGSPSDSTLTGTQKSKDSINNAYRQFSNTSSCKASRTGGYSFDENFDKNVACRLFADEEDETEVRDMPLLN